MSTLINQPRSLYCYRFYAFTDSDFNEEQIWRDVQSWGGRVSIRQDCIDFYVPIKYAAFFTLKYPDLHRQPLLEYL